MSYQFLDANSSILTADSSVIAGAHRPIVQIGSVLSSIPVSGTVTINPASVSGTVGASIIGAVNVNPVSVSGTVNIAGNPSISGTVNIGTIPGSVVAFQGTSPFIITGSVQGIGSVVAFQAGAWAQSVVGIIAPTSSVMSFATAASTTTALAANAARRGAMIANTSGTSIMAKLGAMANSGDFTLLMQNTDYYETPFNYSGRIDYFASSVAGFIKVTEIT